MKKIGAFGLTAATFFMVSGGPYGLEELVLKTGYGGAIAVIFVLAIAWALPTGLMVGELASAIPGEGGFYVWVGRAMGPFWGFQEAWLSLASSVFDMAAYPTLFVLSLGQLWPSTKEHSFAISASLIGLCVIWNLWGAKAVGDASIWLGAILLAPFALLSIWGFTHGRGTAATSVPAGPWFGGVIVAMWNFMGWDNASTIAREVDRPQRVYPRVMIGTLVLIALTYAIPILAARHAGIPREAWVEGNWVGISADIVGPWLGNVVLAATMISVLGIVNSLTMSYSRVPPAMAADGLAPRVLAKTMSNGVPWVSLLVCGGAWTLALTLSFDRILLLDILLYGLSLILEFAALVVLRIKEPELVRPFRVPGGVVATIGIGIAPTALLITAFVANRDEQVGGMSAAMLALIIMLTGVVLYA